MLKDLRGSCCCITSRLFLTDNCGAITNDEISKVKKSNLASFTFAAYVRHRRLLYPVSQCLLTTLLWSGIYFCLMTAVVTNAAVVKIQATAVVHLQLLVWWFTRLDAGELLVLQSLSSAIRLPLLCASCPLFT